MNELGLNDAAIWHSTLAFYPYTFSTQIIYFFYPDHFLAVPQHGHPIYALYENDRYLLCFFLLDYAFFSILFNFLDYSYLLSTSYSQMILIKSSKVDGVCDIPFQNSDKIFVVGKDRSEVAILLESCNKKACAVCLVNLEVSDLLMRYALRLCILKFFFRLPMRNVVKVTGLYLV